MEPIFKTYKGKPIIELNHDTEYPFSFGVTKAQSFLVNIETIRRFIRECDSTGDKRSKLELTIAGDKVELSYYKCNVILENISAIRSFIKANE